MKRAEIELYVDPKATWQTGFIMQYKTLVKRNFLREKHRYFEKLAHGCQVFTALIMGLIWFQTPRDEKTARDRLGCVRT